MDKILNEYAELLISIGVNLQKGQVLNIRTSVECAEFARICVKKAYEHGAKDVIVDWKDDFCSRQHYLFAADEVFDEFPKWNKDKFDSMSDGKTAVLNIYAEDPEAFSDVNPDRITRASIARGNALKAYYAEQMSNGFQWCIGSVPIPAWAKKVFPNDNQDIAMKKLWNAILKTVYVNGDGKSELRWKEHIEKTAERAQKLNNLKIKTLRYTNSLGTDLTVELPEGALWMGGAEKTRNGLDFVANMPTEEIFTAPKKDSANGIVCSSKPLCIDGNIINDIKFTLKEGKIINATSSTCQDVLQRAISVDEGASYFGELALVPYSSPISDMNILFFNTLFDENASCHIAFGEAYPCIKDGDKMPRKELDERGFNYSITHEDFMVGTSDLSIIGTDANGKETVIFKDGNFAI